ncbi:winged helix-turn-helix transcriptional regulator, MarR family [Syntrophotalea carbinolica DSM 2380]|uniref:Winged helix-turn-helix transcriptional regulator, MarR family n=1 Tax=Syntrophotalea carbinolica (strain DSM 2380 / NBRC 103641 / GraBd1) TaxID=338963 RepID=Q3A068_SYNC1|nr:MarR family transcriptional regulator [Syntrophotalea carbinolica]ABA90239.1 winged helix-turn-helix transcriptional regulator, MarR family [Syntrophotalea carbinolica DSM 2380]
MDHKQRIMEIFEIVSRALVNAKMQKLRKIGAREINLTQFQYINAINHAEDLTPTSLAKTLKLSKPAVTGILNKLVEQGYVTKSQSQSDRRVYNIHLTKAGKQVADAYEEACREYIDGMAQALTASELDQLVILMEKALH